MGRGGGGWGGVVMGGVGDVSKSGRPRQRGEGFREPPRGVRLRREKGMLQQSSNSTVVLL